MRTSFIFDGHGMTFFKKDFDPVFSESFMESKSANTPSHKFSDIGYKINSSTKIVSRNSFIIIQCSMIISFLLLSLRRSSDYTVLA